MHSLFPLGGKGLKGSKLGVVGLGLSGPVEVELLAEVTPLIVRVSWSLGWCQRMGRSKMDGEGVGQTLVPSVSLLPRVVLLVSLGLILFKTETESKEYCFLSVATLGWIHICI